MAVLHTRSAPLQQCVALYAQLDQTDALVQEYVKHRPAAIHKLWFDYTPSIPGTNTTTSDHSNSNSNDSASDDFATWLPG